jgi:hypothetical protein
MARSKIGMHMDDALSDMDFEAISEGEETKSSDDICNYYESHKDEAAKSDSKPQLALLF